MPLYPDPVTNPNAPKQVLPIAPSVDIIGFSALMDEALLRRRKPRSYLVPSPTSKYSPNHTFQPQINKRSKEMALRMRPPELSAHEVGAVQYDTVQYSKHVQYTALQYRAHHAITITGVWRRRV